MRAVRHRTLFTDRIKSYIVEERVIIPVPPE